MIFQRNISRPATGNSSPASLVPIRVLLIDDNSDFLSTASRFLRTQAEKEIEVIGSSSSAEEGIALTSLLDPDVVIMDYGMPGMNGFEATQQIKSLPKPPHVILLTLFDSPEYREKALHAGADAFLSKSEFGDMLISLIYRVSLHPPS
ncbi:MAG: response regulator transcription factor [bacterium]